MNHKIMIGPQIRLVIEFINNQPMLRILPVMLKMLKIPKPPPEIYDEIVLNARPNSPQ